MAEVSPVRDPVFENFNFARLLDQAGQPLRDLSAGRLAITQLQGQRAFDLLSQQKASDLAKGRDLARLTEEERINEAHRLKLKNESAAAEFSKAKAANPDYKGPDQKKTIEQNIEDAHASLGQAVLRNVNALSASKAKDEADLKAMYAKAGAYDPPSPAAVNQRILQDPSLTFLNSNDRSALESGMSPEDLIKKWGYTGAKQSSVNALRTSAQQATLTLQQQNMQQAMLMAGADAKLLEGRVNDKENYLTQLKNSPYLPAYTQGLAGALIPPSPQTPSWVRPPPPPGGIKPPPGTTNAPADLPGAPKDVAPSVQTVAGTPSKYDPNTFAPMVHANETQSQIDEETTNLQKKQGDLRYIESVLDNGYVTSPPMQGGLGGGLGMMPPSRVPINDEDRYHYSVLHNQIQKDILKSQGSILKLQDQKRGFMIPPANQNGGGTPSATPAPPAPNQSLQPPLPAAPAAPPTSMNGQQPQFDQLAARNRAYSVLGTSDQATLSRAKQFAISRLGMSEQDVQSTLVAAVRGDPNATAKVRQIIAQSSQDPSAQSAQVDPTQAMGEGMGIGLPPVPAQS